MKNTKTVFEITLGDSTNFMTPELWEYRTEANYHIEVAHGWGIKAPDGSRNELFGITIIEESNNGSLTARHDLSTVVFYEDDIQKYIDVLLNEGENEAIKWHEKYIDELMEA